MTDKVNFLQAKVGGNLPKNKAKDVYELSLDVHGNLDVAEIFPGQFVCFSPLDSASVMSRPFSVATVEKRAGIFSIFYKVVGPNTRLMSGLKSGDTVKFWGPIGSKFEPDYSLYDEVWLVGGGIGIAPLFYFEKVISEFQNERVRVFYGSRNQKEIIDYDFLTSERVEIATDDGSVGFHGPVTTIMAAFVKSVPKQNIMVISCGPNSMMQKVAESCLAYGMPCYVLLEKIMACGIGNCLGCSIKTTQGMKRVCHDGPVFKAEEVIWHELG